jgi:hypothetical protein
MSDNDEGSRMTIRVYFPGSCVAQVSVLPSAEVGELGHFLGERFVRFIYKGHLLLQNSTLEFYGIQSSDLIVALSNQVDLESINKWRTISEDFDEFGERLACLVNPSFAREPGRLRDLQIMRIASRSRGFRRIEALADAAASATQPKPQETVWRFPPPPRPAVIPSPPCSRRRASAR